MAEVDVGRLLAAVNFAAVKHKDQRRKDAGKTPYINHPIGVAYLLWKEGGVTDMVTLQAAVLHDTIEDTATTGDELEREFGVEVRRLVEEVSDDKSLPKMERKRLQIAHAPGKSPQAKLVSLGDKIYNLRDLNQVTPEGWGEQRATEYFQWTAKVAQGYLGVNQRLEAALEDVLNTHSISLYSTHHS